MCGLLQWQREKNLKKNVNFVLKAHTKKTSPSSQWFTPQIAWKSFQVWRKEKKKALPSFGDIAKCTYSWKSCNSWRYQPKYPRVPQYASPRLGWGQLRRLLQWPPFSPPLHTGFILAGGALVAYRFKRMHKLRKIREVCSCVSISHELNSKYLSEKPFCW